MMRWYFYCLLLLTMASINVNAAKGSGRGGNTRGRVENVNHFGSQRLPKQSRKHSNENYYKNENGAKIVKSSHFELDYVLGRKITFFCMAVGLPRPEINWFKDGIELYYHNFFQVHEWTVGNDTIKSKMEIDPTTQKDAGYYECQANNQYAIDRKGFKTDYVTFSF